MAKSACAHAKARFYAIQTYGKLGSVKLYNCPDCKSTISEQSLRESRRAAAPAR